VRWEGKGELRKSEAGGSKRERPLVRTVATPEKTLMLTLKQCTNKHASDYMGWPFSRQFPDGSWHSSVRLGMLSVTHIMPIHSTKYRYGCKYAAYNKQFYATFPWQNFFPDISLTFSKIPDSCQIPWHFQFFQQVVTLCINNHLTICYPSLPSLQHMWTTDNSEHANYCNSSLIAIR